MVILGSRSEKIRKRWRQALTGSYPIHEIGDVIGLCQTLAQHKPAVLLLDSDAIHHRGIRHLKNLLQANPRTRIIFFTDHVEDGEAIAVLKAGASGYCAKSITGVSLKKAVDVVSGGEIWAERRVTSLFIRSAISSGRGRKEGSTNYNKPDSSAAPGGSLLSPREHDVASMIATGEQNKTISSQLSISEKTVKAHLTNIFKKLGLSSRTQLALLVRQHHSTSDFPTKAPHLHLTVSSIENQGGI
jgi:two-component system, NarL family, nitrate/nitrite response regulator NarL